MFKIDYIGCHYKESTSLVIDRPFGSGNYLFLLFHTSIDIRINSTINRYPAGTCILFDPDYPQYYCNKSDGFDNDWFHFSGPGVSSLARELSLPLNTPLLSTNTFSLHQQCQQIEKEHLMKDKGAQIKIDSWIKNIIVDLARSLEVMANDHRHMESAPSFRKIRSTILSDLRRHWTVEDMARMADLSRSRFSHLYKEIFGISPKEDLLSERMNMAKHLLITQNQRIGDIANRVGYDNLYHFSKQFKLMSGYSPSEYRHIKNNI